MRLTILEYVGITQTIGLHYFVDSLLPCGCEKLWCVKLVVGFNPALAYLQRVPNDLSESPVQRLAGPGKAVVFCIAIAMLNRRVHVQLRSLWSGVVEIRDPYINKPPPGYLGYSSWWCVYIPNMGGSLNGCFPSSMFTVHSDSPLDMSSLQITLLHHIKFCMHDIFCVVFFVCVLLANLLEAVKSALIG